MNFYISISVTLLLISIGGIVLVESVGEKAEIKCSEYGELVYSYEESPVLSRQTKLVKVSQCGIVDVPLIVGGEKARETEFPHMASIGYENQGSIKWLCGGSLISENFVLTAAHCLISPDNVSATKVLLGTIDLSAMGEGSQMKDIVQRIAHPLYNPPSKYNDIALLQLDSPVLFTKYVRPACIARSNDVNDVVSATGFGKESYSAPEGSKQLMKVQLNIIPYEKCKQQFYKKSTAVMINGLEKSMLCAGVLTGGKDTCQGDSGGPLQTVLKQPYCMYNIIGITSVGKFCGFPNAPSIYTKAADYLGWIENMVWP
ncbi:serine protease snake-like [Agrilus planipennis]|uniref:Serine protease snake-like n=1 Tax=Agrilus planipennis TaxID=224129 RepID=A0A1W4WXU4_AGRPL|nr:serine protease snake-like [Agrilus planipennis]